MKRERTRKENIDKQYYNRKICRVVFLTSRTLLVESVNALELASISGMFENNVLRSFSGIREEKDINNLVAQKE